MTATAQPLPPIDPRQAAYAEDRRRHRAAVEHWLATRPLPGSPSDGSGKRGDDV